MVVTTEHPTAHTWSALGCTIYVGVRERHDLQRAVEVTADILRDVDEVASRFRPESDLSRVNGHPGTWVEVDPLLVAAVEVAIQAAEATDGLVHPLLGRSLISLGYDRDFTSLRSRTSASALAPPRIDAWRDIQLDPAGALRIPADTALDLGATAKAWCTDLIVAAFAEQLDDDAIVSVGGDLRASGVGPWEVAISERPGADPDQVVELIGGAIATSSTQVRRWIQGGVRRHHLVDPRTGEPASEVWRTVSVAATSCVAANTASTAAILHGAAAVAYLTDRDRPLDARLVALDGHIVVTGTWPDQHRAPHHANGAVR